MINYLDRQALAFAGPELIKRYDISNTEFGIISSAFLFAYGFGQLVTGPLVDRFGTIHAPRNSMIRICK